MNTYIKNLNKDLPASIIVFLVAIPLCLGIALASGAPLFSGIISGIVGGIVVGFISRSPLGVSGPAAGLAVIVLNAIIDLQVFEIFLLAVVLSGVFQLILGFLRAGIIGYYFPSSVIKGMLSGIGIIIILKQIPHAFGYDADPEGDFAFFGPDGHNTFSNIFVYMWDSITPAAIIITVVSMTVLILWEQKFMKQIKLFQIVQGPLVVVIAGILLNVLFQSMNNLGLADNQVVSLPVAGSIEGFINQFTLPDFTAITNPKIWIIGLTIAVVASLETLLCVEATDKLDPEKRVTPTNRELKAQGVGNIISGLIGGLPVTQVIVRSSANIQSGGKTKQSAIFHGFFILICVAAIPHVLNLIPLASLAAILFLVGYKLAKPSLFKQMFDQGISQSIPFLVTILGIVFIDLLWGIGLGLAVAIFVLLYRNFKKPYRFHVEKHEQEDIIKIDLAEEVSFLNKAAILQTLNNIPEKSHVIIDASNSYYIHEDVLEIIKDFMNEAHHSHLNLEVIGMDEFENKKVDPVASFNKSVNKN